MPSETLHPQPPTQRPGCFFVIGWMIATVLGFILSLSMLVVGERPDLGLQQGFLGGSVVGLLQGLVLIRYRFRGGWWIVATALAWGIAGASSIGVVGWFAPRGLTILSSRLIYGAISGLKIGLIAGFVQWLSLRLTLPKFSISWIAWNTVAWMVGLASGWAIGGVLRRITNLFISELFGLTLAWLIVGLIGGVALSHLLSRTHQQGQNAPIPVIGRSEIPNL